MGLKILRGGTGHALLITFKEIETEREVTFKTYRVQTLQDDSIVFLISLSGKVIGMRRDVLQSNGTRIISRSTKQVGNIKTV